MIWEPVFWENLELCAKYHRPGMSVVECGVWKGGMIGGIAAALKDEKAQFHLFDSFEGLPEAQPIDGKRALDWQGDKESPIYYDNCRASLDDAKEAMALSGAGEVFYYPGWFEETLSGFKAPVPISILRLDADWYASTAECLKALYPQVAAGGVIILDDYYTWDGCCRAVHDYLSENKLTDRIRSTAHDVAYIVKGSDQDAS